MTAPMQQDGINAPAPSCDKVAIPGPPPRLRHAGRFMWALGAASGRTLSSSSRQRSPTLAAPLSRRPVVLIAPRQSTSQYALWSEFIAQHVPCSVLYQKGTMVGDRAVEVCAKRASRAPFEEICAHVERLLHATRHWHARVGRLTDAQLAADPFLAANVEQIAICSAGAPRPGLLRFPHQAPVFWAIKDCCALFFSRSQLVLPHPSCYPLHLSNPRLP